MTGRLLVLTVILALGAGLVGGSSGWPFSPGRTPTCKEKLKTWNSG